MTNRIVIRPMAESDMTAVRRLLGQLGYDVDAADLAKRFEAVSGASAHDIIVAEQDGRLVGMMHVFERPALEKPPEAVVQAIVVDDAARGSGLGRALMQAAEDWAAERDFDSIALGSSVERAGAHAFYRRLGYDGVATFDLMRKRLDGGTA